MGLEVQFLNHKKTFLEKDSSDPDISGLVRVKKRKEFSIAKIQVTITKQFFNNQLSNNQIFEIFNLDIGACL